MLAGELRNCRRILAGSCRVPDQVLQDGCRILAVILQEHFAGMLQIADWLLQHYQGCQGTWEGTSLQAGRCHLDRSRQDLQK
jgi:hypothetical protein